MPSVSHDGAEIHYRDQGRGPALLLLHAYPLSSKSFQPQLDGLSSRFRVIAPDHRGLGLSTAGGVPTMDQLASDALAILEVLKISSAVVGGVSMGGYVAMALTRLDPSRVRGLVLIDTQAGADDEAGRAKREEVARSVESGGMQVLVESMLPRLVSPKASDWVKATVEAEIRSNDPAGASAAQRAMALREDSKGILARFSGPALVVVGAEDVITPPEKARQMADLIPQSEFVELPGAGHLAHLETPAAFNAALIDFLERRLS